MRIGCKNDLWIVIIYNDIGLLCCSILCNDLHVRLMAGPIVVVVTVECCPVGIEKVIWQAVAVVNIGLLIGCAKLWLYGTIIGAHNDVFMLCVQFSHIIVVAVLVLVVVSIRIAVAIVTATAVANVGGIKVIYKNISIGCRLGKCRQEAFSAAHIWRWLSRLLITAILLRGKHTKIIIVWHLQIQRQRRISIVGRNCDMLQYIRYYYMINIINIRPLTCCSSSSGSQRFCRSRSLAQCVVLMGACEDKPLARGECCCWCCCIFTSLSL